MSSPKNYLIDMDGVLVRGRTAIPGAQAFLERLDTADARYLLLTNNPIYTPGDLAHRLSLAGLQVPTERIFTSAMATTMFLQSQRPHGGSAFVIGDSGLTEALHHANFVLTDHAPDFVVLGETHHYNFDAITHGVRLLSDGAHFIATNPDASCPTERGIAPACGAIAALMQTASGVEPFFVGKPNPLMMRTALNFLGVHSETAVMIGDNMRTDIIGGVEAGTETILVLTGVTPRDGVTTFSYQPTQIVDSIADIEVAMN